MIAVVHASGGPLQDIVVPVDGLPTGELFFFAFFCASTWVDSESQVFTRKIRKVSPRWYTK